VTDSTFKDISANGDVYENRHYLWGTLSVYIAFNFPEFTTEGFAYTTSLVACPGFL
jgi:hypothetical protein